MSTLRRLTHAACGFAVALALAGAAEAAKQAPAGKININTANVEQLSTLPGVGPKLAARIVEYRQKSGGFKSAQELMNVRGVGEKGFAKLQPHLSVGDKAPSATANH